MKRFLAGVCSAVLLSSQAFAARPVARWDVVPDQLVDGVFKAGVVAFHESGVRVEFDVAGTKFTAANPTFNDRVGVWEYVCPIDVAKLPDGPFTVAAEAVPFSADESFTLPELRLYANSNGSLDSDSEVWVDSVNGDDSAAGTADSPLRTLAAASGKVSNGGTVFLAAGSYGIDGLEKCTGPRWTTVTHAPGVARDAVVLAPGRPGADHLHFREVTFAMVNESGYKSMISGENGATVCWIDECVGLNRLGRWSGNSKWFGNRMEGYFTGGVTTEMTDGPDGSLIRGHLVEKIASDAWTGSERLVVNCRCSDVNPGSTGAHPDFFQSYAAPGEWVHDVILYNVSGVDCASQGLFGVRLRDSAFVNVSIQATAGMYTQWSDEMANVMFWHVTLVDQAWLWREGTPGKSVDYAPVGVSVRNCMLKSMGSSVPVESFNGGLTVDHCAFYATDRYGAPAGTFGADFISVERCFRDETGRDYTPTNAAALSHGVPLQCVPADIGGRPYAAGPRAVGAYTPQPAEPPEEPPSRGFSALAWTVPKNLTDAMRSAVSEAFANDSPDFAFMQGCSGSAICPWPEIGGWSFSVGRPAPDSTFGSLANTVHALYWSDSFTLLKEYPVVLQGGSTSYASHRVVVGDSAGGRYGLMTFAGNPNLGNGAVTDWLRGLVGDITGDYPSATVVMNVCRQRTTSKYGDLAAFLGSLGFVKAAETDENGLFVLGAAGSASAGTRTDARLTAGAGSFYVFGAETPSDPTPALHTVFFDAAGGEPAPAAQIVEDGAAAGEPSPAPEKSGFAFDGWFNGGSEWNFAEDAVFSDVTLTARWRAAGSGPGHSSGSGMKILGWTLMVKGYGQALGSSNYAGALKALQDSFAEIRPTVAFLTGAKGDSEFGIPGYGVAHTLVDGVPTKLGAVEGVSEIVAWDAGAMTLVEDGGVRRCGGAAADHTVVLADGAGRGYAFTMIQGTNLNVGKPVYQTYVQSVLDRIAADYPHLAVSFIAYSKRAGNTNAGNEAALAAYLTGRGYAEISRTDEFVFFSRPACEPSVSEVVNAAASSCDAEYTPVPGVVLALAAPAADPRAGAFLFFR